MDRHARTRYALLIAAISCAQLQGQKMYRLVDVERVPAVGNAATAIVAFREPVRPQELDCGILIAGAGVGGIGAALRAAGRGHSVCLLEESDWVGGQITAGGVSALDENRFIEISGGTRKYMEMRQRIRDHYWKSYTLSAKARGWAYLNPGSCYVSPLCFEPKVGVAVLEAMLREAPNVQLFRRTKVADMTVRAKRITSVLAWQFDKKQAIRFKPGFVLDATELGDLLPLAGVPYVAGSEAKAETGEPHASAAPNAACVQSFTYPFALEHGARAGEGISKPPNYEGFRDGQPFSFRMNYPKEFGWRGQFDYKMFGDDPPVPNNMSPGSFFAWRRLLDSRNFEGPKQPRDLALINWPRQDFHSETLIDRSLEDTARVLQLAKQVSLSFLYWLRNDLPRDEGKGTGYPELLLRKDVMGTEDGLSKYPYIRESRRLKAKGRVVEQDIVDEYQKGSRAKWFDDAVGTGFYMVDIHPCGANEKGRMMMPKPFQIPMAALLQDKVENFLPAAKNIGVTHLANGAFRLHPIEWNVGEASAVIASMAMQKGSWPEARAVQRELVKAGVQIVWFDDLPSNDLSFEAVQWAAIRHAYPLSDAGLHASVDAPVTRAEAASALLAHFGDVSVGPLQAVENGWLAADHRNWFHGDLPFYWTDLRFGKLPRPTAPPGDARAGPVKRSEFATWLNQP